MAKRKKAEKTTSPTTGSFTDEAERDALRSRLRRIEGQVRGLGVMVDENRYCMDVLTQIAAAREGLRAVGHAVIRSHLEHCVREACTRPDGRADEVIDELLEVLKRYR